MSFYNGLFPFVNVKINPHNYPIYYKIHDNIVTKIISMLGAKIILSFFLFYIFYGFIW
jgi:hypothetical protein